MIGEQWVVGTRAACRRTETNNSAYCYLTNDDDCGDQSYNIELAAWDIVVITDGKSTFYVGEAVSEALHECIAHARFKFYPSLQAT